jgi:hypothetical protein
VIRRLLVVSAAVVVTGPAIIVGLDAAATAWLDDAATTVLLALVAVFLAQADIAVLRGGRRLSPARQQWRCHGHALWHGRVRHHRYPAVPPSIGAIL